MHPVRASSVPPSITYCLNSPSSSLLGIVEIITHTKTRRPPIPITHIIGINPFTTRPNFTNQYIADYQSCAARTSKAKTPKSAMSLLLVLFNIGLLGSPKVPFPSLVL